MPRFLARVAATAVSLVLCASAAVAQDKVRVGSKIDTEGALVGNLIIHVLEAKGIKTENKLQLGPTKIVRSALLAGEIDLYPEYTGNAAFFFNDDRDPVWKDGARGWEKARALDRERNKLAWLKPAPANNAWAIALRSDVASAEKLATMADFARWVSGGGPVKLAASAEFVESPAALPAFEAAYGFKLKSNQVVTLAGGDTAATIRAAAEKTSGVNSAMAYGTDGALAALGLTVMSDPKGAQIVYAPAPVVRAAVLERHPEIAQALEPVFAALDQPTLQSLNAKIAVDGEDAKQVALGFLKLKGLAK
jgi:osmoprotectant transport system substrate-binding protein